MVTFQQVDFKIQDNVTIIVNELFSHGTFISYDDFHEKITPIHENGYLVLKHHLMTIFRPSGKYGPPIINKNVQDWNIESMNKLFNKKQRVQKNSGKGSLPRKKLKTTEKLGKPHLKIFQ